MARRAPSFVGGVDDKNTDDGVRSPSTRSYLPEVNFLLCGEGPFPVGFTILAPLGRSLSLSSLSSLSLSKIAALSSVTWQLFLVESSSVGLINSVVTTMAGSVISENWSFIRFFVAVEFAWIPR